MTPSSSKGKKLSKFIVPISEYSKALPIDYSKEELKTFTSSIHTIDKYITKQAWFIQYIRSLFDPLPGKRGERLSTAPISFPVESKEFWKPYLETAQKTKFKKLAEEGKFESEDLTENFIKTLILSLDSHIQSSSNVDSYFSRTLYSYPEFNSIILKELWNAELKKRYEHLLTISPNADLETQLSTLIYCLTEMDKCISHLQFSALKNTSDKHTPYQFSCIKSFLADLISTRELWVPPNEDFSPQKDFEPDKRYIPSKSEEFKPFLVENIPIFYNNCEYSLQQVFQSLSPESHVGFISTKKIKLNQKEREALLEACRRQYLAHLLDKRSPSDFQSKYQPLVYYVKTLSTPINQEMITSFIRQGYVYAFSCIIADYLLQEKPFMPEGDYTSLGYLVNWINSRIYADCQELKTKHHYTIQAIQHLCSFRAGAYTSDAQKVTQLLDDIISILTNYANVLPQEAIKRIKSRTTELIVSSPEETEHLCIESWHAFYAIWNDTCQSSGYTLPNTPSNMTDEMINGITITLKNELEQARYLRPQNVKLDLTEDQLRTILIKFISAASSPSAIGAQNMLLNSAAIILDATFTVYLHHHIEQKITESTQAVEMLRELYKDNYTP